MSDKVGKAHCGAMIAMLGLALTLASCGGGQSQAAAATATLIPIPTTPPTQTPAHNPWTAVTDLNTVATIAPAQFRTQFKTFAGVTAKSSPPELWVKRSDDFGVIYHNVSLPAIPGGTNPTNVQILDGAPSPLNPSVYFLTAQTQQSCANSSPCQYQYVTMDGGASWRALNLPAHGILGVKAIGSAGARAQGQRLFGVVTDVILASSGVVPPGRLVVSNDGGATWALADTAIFAASQWIYDYAPVAGSSTVFALAGKNEGPGLPAQTPPLSVWRSDDAGASWKKMGPLPGAYSLGLQAAVITQTGKTALYTLVGDASDDFHLYASVDGGATWPATYDFHKSRDLTMPNAFPGFIGTLADGAVAIASYDYSTLAWSPADTAPTMSFPAPPGLGFVRGELLTPSNSLGVYSLWITSQDSNGKLTYFYASAQ